MSEPSFTCPVTMKRILLIAAAFAAIAAGGLAASAPAHAAPAQPTVAAAHHRLPVFYKFPYATPRVRPTLVAWGAGGGLFVRGLSWNHWTLTSAYGRGTRWYNLCNPTYSAGNYIKSPASITFWRARWHSGQRYWTRLTMRWTRNGTRHVQRYRYPTGRYDAVGWP